MATGQLQRLLELRDYFMNNEGYSEARFLLQAHISNGYFNTRIKAKGDISKKGVSIKKIKSVLEGFPQVSRDWLVFGIGEMFDSNVPHEVDNASEGAPYYNVDFRGGFLPMANEQNTVPDGYISMNPFNGSDFLWCNITGDSMAPLILSGSRICLQIVYGGVEAINYGSIYALVVDKHDGDIMRTVKWVTRCPDDDTKIRLVPENKDMKYTYEDCSKDSVLNIFKVVFSGKVF